MLGLFIVVFPVWGLAYSPLVKKKISEWTKQLIKIQICEMYVKRGYKIYKKLQKEYKEFLYTLPNFP